VFYVCLALGFEGRYRLSAGRELQTLQAELRQEIVAAAGRDPEALPLSPHGPRPDAVAPLAGPRLPLPIIGAAFLLVVIVTLALIGRSVASDARSAASSMSELGGR
jgi:type VI secretion system protein ImpK